MGLRETYLLTLILRGLYCTFFIRVGGFKVAPKLKLCLHKLGDLAMGLIGRDFIKFSRFSLGENCLVRFQLLTTLYCPSPTVRFTGAPADAAGASVALLSRSLHRAHMAEAAATVALACSNFPLSCSMAIVNSTILRSLRWNKKRFDH